MRFRYTGHTPVYYGTQVVRSGEEIDLPVAPNPLFVPIEKAVKEVVEVPKTKKETKPKEED